jgi:sugar phosphate permease
VLILVQPASVDSPRCTFTALAKEKLPLRRALLLPLVFVTYSLAYLDRANFGFGAAAGLATTLGIDQQRAALLGALFFLGYFLCQIPGMLLARRVSCTRLVFIALVAWGCLASLTGVIRNFYWLCADRLLLGVAESIIFPALLLLLTHWFTRSERSRANSILMLGNPTTVLWMSVVTGYLIQQFGWQHTFIVEGLPAVLWAFVWIAFVRDKPAQARWMPREEVRQLEVAITAQQPVVHEDHKDTSLLRVLLSRNCLLLSAQYFWWSVGVYGFVLWLPTIVRQGASLSMGKTGLLSALPYVFAILFLIIVGQLSDRTMRRKEFVWPCMLIAGIAMMGSFLFGGKSFTLAFACMVVACGAMYAPYGPFFAMVPERTPRAMAGEVFAMVNSSGALGAFAGSYLVGLLQALTHSSQASYLFMAISFLIAALITFALPTQVASATMETSHA